MNSESHSSIAGNEAEEIESSWVVEVCKNCDKETQKIEVICGDSESEPLRFFAELLKKIKKDDCILCWIFTDDVDMLSSIPWTRKVQVVLLHLPGVNVYIIHLKVLPHDGQMHSKQTLFQSEKITGKLESPPCISPAYGRALKHEDAFKLEFISE